MKKIIVVVLFIQIIVCFKTNAQDTKSSEKYGNTLNLGIGIGGYSGYSRYVGHSMPVLHLDYEFDVASNLTLAPFLNFYTYKNNYYWGDYNKNYPFKNYYYKETVIPVGVKGTYYFDKLLQANSKWDFYLAGSLGYAIVNSTWDSDYYGDQRYYHNGNSLFFDLHLGAEYHINKNIGLFLDLSSGVSTVGLSIH